MKLSVGILAAPQIRFTLRGAYRMGQEILEAGRYALCTGAEQATLHAPCGCERTIPLPLQLDPVDYATAEVELEEVVIGIDFHWERKENQCFRGGLRVIEEQGMLRAINVLDIEDYLLSVISSEMSATSSLELLKAHAVISRSWLLAQKLKSERIEGSGEHYSSTEQSEEEYIRWFDREDHTGFDVCADDHCQRYQGINRATTEVVRRAIAETAGEVVAYGGEICDARFSKCCGGIAERFENVWEPVVHPYLREIYDAPRPDASWDLTREPQAARWIEARPADVFCNTTDPAILGQVLNSYDQETQDFFRWSVEFTQAELSELIRERLGIDFGTVTELIPVQRGPSGRLIRLRVVGTERELVIGKELVIRRAFSRSHLYSSAFIVERTPGGGFRLRGAGWGHGVGLCQIGAAVMGAKGYGYREILAHYFPGSEIEKRY